MRDATVTDRPAPPPARAPSVPGELWSDPGLPFPGLAGRHVQPAAHPVRDGLLGPWLDVWADVHAQDWLPLDVSVGAQTGQHVEHRDARVEEHGACSSGSAAVGSPDLVALPRHRTSRVALRSGSWRRGRPHSVGSKRTGRVLVVGAVALAVGALGAGSVVLLAPAASPATLRRHVGAASAQASVPRTVPRPSDAPPGATGAGPSSSGPKSSLPRSAFGVPTPNARVIAASTPGTVSAPNASSSASTGSSPGIEPTAAQAEVIFAGLWSTRSAALAAGNLSQLASAESGAALASDTAAVESGEAVASSPVGKPQLYIPDPRAYPSSFLAVTMPPTSAVPPSGAVPPSTAVPPTSAVPPSSVVPPSTATGAARELAVVSRSSPNVPWSIALVVPIPDVSSAPVSNSARGSTGSLATLAADWQQWVVAGQAPQDVTGGFAAGGVYQAVGREVVEQIALASLRGIDEHVVFSPSSARGSTFEVQSTVCGAVDEIAVFTSGTGGPLLQPPSQSTWGTAVAPGKYRQVTESSVHEVCVVPTRAGDVVVGASSVPYSAATTVW